MEERLRFVFRRLEGEPMTALCREFGISRKTGHKIFNRYREHGAHAVADRPRRPNRVRRLPVPVEAVIVALRREHPSWGARKLRELVARRLGPGVPVPARSTVHAVLDRHGLVEHARARRPRATGTPLSAPAAPNDLWCADFKGEFRLGNGRLCYPLTVTDQVSRYLLMVEALEGRRRRRSSPLSTGSSRSAACRAPSARTSNRRFAFGERGTLREPRPLRALAALGLVAQARDRARADQARQAARDTAGTSACT